MTSQSVPNNYSSFKVLIITLWSSDLIEDDIDGKTIGFQYTYRELFFVNHSSVSTSSGTDVPVGYWVHVDKCIVWSLSDLIQKPVEV